MLMEDLYQKYVKKFYELIRKGQTSHHNKGRKAGSGISHGANAQLQKDEVMPNLAGSRETDPRRRGWTDD